ncbi:endonuclease VII domain-containing protein [Micromonospora taraxaci]|uniref:endonuclease VII domain-containing protein n=1 Tax=Micromonospora taraxaci TaxID=1316803 RepID=UPI00339DD5B3
METARSILCEFEAAGWAGQLLQALLQRAFQGKLRASSEGKVDREVRPQRSCQRFRPACDAVKPSEAFPRNRADASGYATYCKPCRNTPTTAVRRGGEGVSGALAEQGGVCAICGGADPQHLDHDHRTGWVRGILCFNCNGGLGQLRDSPMRLARAITY